MDSTAILSTLQSITAVKRQELTKQRAACDALRQELLGSLQNHTDARKRVEVLLDSAGQRSAPPQPDGTWRRTPRARHLPRVQKSNQHEEILSLAGLSAFNIQRFLAQAEADASIPASLFNGIEERFRAGLNAQQVKYEYATLFSDLVAERAAEQSKEDAQQEGDFERIGRAEMHEQRQEWESRVFTAQPRDRASILSALETTFHTPEARASLTQLREEMGRLCSRLLEPRSVGIDELKNHVRGLIASDLLTSEQTAALKQVRDSRMWLGEMVDVLNLRLASIERWSWETDALPIEMRRHLNGKYRVFMLEEITQALLIFHIGQKFAEAFRSMARTFYSSPGWKHQAVDYQDQARWDYFVGRGHMQNESIRESLAAKYLDDYFMCTLPSGPGGAGTSYGDAQDGEQPKSDVAKAINDKQSLLHIIVAESLMADHLNEDLMVLQTDFRWFGPSLSHDTIAAVLHFFGVTELWSSFFDKFLHAPLRFVHDGPDGVIRTRQRGVPMSHVLSDFFGEAALFCVDFAVNQATGGKPMFRMHDDIWLWGTMMETIQAWQALTALTETMGIAINKDKTGAARITCKNNTPALPPELPVGPLRWGLLRVDQTGQFEIDPAQIDDHIKELRHQLASRKSILAWIKAYNAYMHFFHLHFCRPVNAMGRRHVDQCIATLKRIHAELFPETEGNAAAHVKQLLSQRFGFEDIPDGFVYFPMTLGGLELHNPFIALQNRRENVVPEPAEILQEAVEREEVEYRRLCGLFYQNGPSNAEALADRPPVFMMPADFARFRRERNTYFLQAWQELLEDAVEDGLDRSQNFEALLGASGHQIAQEYRPSTKAQEPYWLSVFELYGKEMGERFGGLLVVEKDWLPMGMMDVFRGRVRWEA